jgi:hypothetical protein
MAREMLCDFSAANFVLDAGRFFVQHNQQVDHRRLGN